MKINPKNLLGKLFYPYLSFGIFIGIPNICTAGTTTNIALTQAARDACITSLASTVPGAPFALRTQACIQAVGKPKIAQTNLIILMAQQALKNNNVDTTSLTPEQMSQIFTAGVNTLSNAPYGTLVPAYAKCVKHLMDTDQMMAQDKVIDLVISNNFLNKIDSNGENLTLPQIQIIQTQGCIPLSEINLNQDENTQKNTYVPISEPLVLLPVRQEVHEKLIHQAYAILPKLNNTHIVILMDKGEAIANSISINTDPKIQSVILTSKGCPSVNEGMLIYNLKIHPLEIVEAKTMDHQNTCTVVGKYR